MAGLKKKGEIVEEGATDLPKGVETAHHHVQELETETTPMMDLGTGMPIILRTFEFKANPEAFRLKTPSKQELLNTHANGIRAHLWGDGLKIVEYLDPKIQIAKKKTHYRIIVAAQARPGQTVAERPAKLQEVLNGRP